MATKTTGAEFKRFYKDPAFWPDGVWHEDETVTVNGEEVGPNGELGKIADDAVVTVDGGIVLGPKWKENEPSFEGYFKSWRKQQTTKSFVVECDESKLEAVKAAIKAAGGRVVK